MGLSDLLRRVGFSDDINTKEYIKLTKKLLRKSIPINPKELKEFGERVNLIGEVFDYINNNAKKFLSSYIDFFKSSYKDGNKSELLDEITGLLNIVGVTDNKNAMSVLEDLGVTFFYDSDEIKEGKTYVNPYSFRKAMWKARRKSRSDLIKKFVYDKITPLDCIISKAAKHAGLMSNNILQTIGYYFIRGHLLTVDKKGNVRDNVRGSGEFSVDALFINPKDLTKEDIEYGVNELVNSGVDYDPLSVEVDLLLLGYDIKVPEKKGSSIDGVSINNLYNAVGLILGDDSLKALKLIGASPNSLDSFKNVLSGYVYTFLYKNMDDESLNEKIMDPTTAGSLFINYVKQATDYSKEDFVNFLNDS